MAHLQRIASYLVALLLGLSSFKLHSSLGGATGPISPERQRILAVVESHVGICATNMGRHDGPQLLRFQRTTGNGSGENWCASFIFSSFVEADLRRFLPPGANGAARSFFDKGRDIYKNGRYLTGQVPRPGDEFGYIYRPSVTVHHIGIETGAWGDKPLVYDTEGNYGDCVKVVLRPKKVIAVVSCNLP